MKIGCIGQGFVGKNLSNDLEERGFNVIRYSLDDAYILNQNKIKDCDIVFIAVPTPTTPEGFNHDLIREVLPLVKDGSIVVLKSTLIPGTTQKLQDEFKNKIILCSPEFLSEQTASFDSARPYVNVIGMAYDTASHRQAALKVQSVLPHTSHNFIVPSGAAEVYKYAHNLNGYFRIILTNLLFDMAEKNNVDWADVKSMMDSDIMMSPYYNKPVHKGGRGAGGNCFVKDMAAFRHEYEALFEKEDEQGIAVLKALERKNLQLLTATSKSQEIIRQVYGETMESI